MNAMETAVASTDQEVTNIPALPLHHDPASARADIAAWDALHREEKHVVQERHSIYYSAGRLLLAALFLVMAGFKLTHFQDTVNAVATSGYGDASILVSFALLLELVGGALIALGLRVRTAAAGLIGYLVLVTVLLNWDQSLAINRALALANCGCIAALLLLTAHGAGGFSLERYLARQHARSGKA
jgi:putative oxidoreductase